MDNCFLSFIDCNDSTCTFYSPLPISKSHNEINALDCTENPNHIEDEKENKLLTTGEVKKSLLFNKNNCSTKSEDIDSVFFTNSADLMGISVRNQSENLETQCLSSESNDLNNAVFIKSADLSSFLTGSQTAILNTQHAENSENFPRSTEFFKYENSLDFLETIQTSNKNALPRRNSIWENFDPLLEKMDKNIIEQGKSSTVNEDEIKEVSTKYNNDARLEKKLVNYDLNETQSNLLVNPIKNHSTCMIKEFRNAEKELKQVRKIRELSQQTFELQTSKNIGEQEKKYKMLNNLCISLLEIVSNYAKLIKELQQEKELLEEKIDLIEIHNQKLNCSLRSTAEDMKQAKHSVATLKDFLKQCQEMLKNFQENDIKLKKYIDHLQDVTVQKDIQINNLKLKMQVFSDEANCDAKQAVFETCLKKNKLKISALESSLNHAKMETTELENIVNELSVKVKNP